MGYGFGRWAAPAIAASLALSACGGGAEFQYLESEDGHAFGKIPADWTVVREGAVAWSLVNEGNVQLAFVDGDDTTPWRAVFTAGESDAIVDELPAGLIEVQHVDARLRDSFDVTNFLKTIPSFELDGDPIGRESVEVVGQRAVRVGDLQGYRVELRVDIANRSFDQLMLTDPEQRAFYIVSVSCSADCLERHADDIDEIMTTFTVE